MHVARPRDACVHARAPSARGWVRSPTGRAPEALACGCCSPVWGRHPTRGGPRGPPAAAASRRHGRRWASGRTGSAALPTMAHNGVDSGDEGPCTPAAVFRLPRVRTDRRVLCTRLPSRDLLTPLLTPYAPNPSTTAAASGMAAATATLRRDGGKVGLNSVSSESARLLIHPLVRPLARPLARLPPRPLACLPPRLPPRTLPREPRPPARPRPRSTRQCRSRATRSSPRDCP